MRDFLGQNNIKKERSDAPRHIGDDSKHHSTRDVLGQNKTNYSKTTLPLTAKISARYSSGRTMSNAPKFWSIFSPPTAPSYVRPCMIGVHPPPPPAPEPNMNLTKPKHYKNKKRVTLMGQEKQRREKRCQRPTVMISARHSSGRITSRAPTFWSICSTFVAPMRAAVMNGLK